jgi:hypothetical protein
VTNIKEVEELINNSGNNFHAKVARWFSENKWHVVVSPYYMDQSLSKAREIDLIVEKEHPIYNGFNHLIGHVVIRLFVECKYVPAPSVFWFSYKDGNAARNLVYKGGIFRKDNTFSDHHHYLATSERVAKLFASSSSKSTENEPFYKALNQVLNGMVSMSGREISIPELKKFPGSNKVLLEFPVVVCSSFDKLYQVGFDKESSPEKITDNFQLEVIYAYTDRGSNSREEYFLIDMVEMSQLGKYYELLEKDIKAAAHLGFNE